MIMLNGLGHSIFNDFVYFFFTYAQRFKVLIGERNVFCDKILA